MTLSFCSWSKYVLQALELFFLIKPTRNLRLRVRCFQPEDDCRIFRHSFVEMSLVNIYQALPGKLHGQRSLVGYSP